MNRIINAIKNVINEIKLVEFPTRLRAFKDTNVVILISVLLGIFLIVIDTLFATIRNYITFNI